MPLAQRTHKIRQHGDSKGREKMRGRESERKKRGEKAERRKQQQTDALDAIYKTCGWVKEGDSKEHL